jgi:hypothetical protein
MEAKELLRMFKAALAENKEMEDVLRKIMIARDHNADLGSYPDWPDGPTQDQCFDDWAADLASRALGCWEPSSWRDMWLINGETGRIESWDSDWNPHNGNDARAVLLVKVALRKSIWTHEIFTREEAEKALELEDYYQTNDSMDKMSENLNLNEGR